MNDPINPDYYDGDECMQAIATATKNLHGEEAVCTGFIIKYLWRWKQKGGLEDLNKAEWYLKRLKEAFTDVKDDRVMPEYERKKEEYEHIQDLQEIVSPGGRFA